MVNSISPLRLDERGRFLDFVRKNRELTEARTAWTIYSCGAHPWSLAHPAQARFTITEESDGKYIGWRYPKTRTTERKRRHVVGVDAEGRELAEVKITKYRPRKQTMAHVPLNPEIAPWIASFLENELGYTEEEYRLRVVEVGELSGLPGLTPRTLRHDFCFRACLACNWDLNRASLLAGTTVSTLLRYTRDRPLDLGEGAALLF